MFPLLTCVTLAGFITDELYGPGLLAIALLGWLLYALFFGKRALIYMQDSGIVIWLMPILCLVSYYWSVEKAYTLRAAIETCLMIAMIVMITHIISPRQLIYCLFATCAMIAIISVPINHLTFDYMAGKTNHTGIFDNKNSFSLCSAGLVMASIAIFLDKKSQVMRWLVIPFIPLGLYQNLQANSVATTLCLAIALGWGMTIFVSKTILPQFRSSFVTWVLVAGVIAIGVGTYIVVDMSDELVAMVGKDSTLTGRTDLWYHAERIIAEQSWLGMGYHAFWIVGHPYAEYLWFIEHIDSGSGFSFHNLYYEVCVELGYPGVIIGAFVIVTAFINVCRWVRYEQTIESVFWFCMVVFILIIQTQGYDLFATFDTWYAMFTMAMIYSTMSVPQVRAVNGRRAMA